MKRKCAELKRIAREHLTFQYGIPMLAMVSTYAISVVLSYPFTTSAETNPTNTQWGIYFLATFIISLIQTILGFGLCRIHLGLARQEKVQTTDLFYYFRNQPDRYIIYGLLTTVVTLVCMIPFFIASGFYLFSPAETIYDIAYILAAVLCVLLLVFVLISLSLSQYLLIDHTDWTVRESFRKSMELMRGNKGRLFYLYLSFIGWGILGLLTFYIGFLWIRPYLSQTLCVFYLDVTWELDEIEKRKFQKYEQPNNTVNYTV